MKKLITIMAAAVSALFAFGDGSGFISGTSLESYLGALKTDKSDDGASAADTFWYLDNVAAGEAELTVTNIVRSNLPARPNYYEGVTPNANYLEIETASTSQRLYRSIKANDQSGSFTPQAISDGIYLDTLVQFTAAEEQFKDDAITEGDKIAIEYVENEEEGYTNFVVRAGFVDVANSTLVATNYFLTFPDQPANEVQFDKTAWHRLTVRAIPNVGNAYAPVGFVVYVDGTNLVYKAGSNGCTNAGDDTYVGDLNTVVSTYLYASDNHALLPSLLRYGETGYSTLSAVAFSGKGSVDDISFTTEKPTMGADPFLPVEGTTVTIAWDAHVASYTVVAGETTLIDGEVVSGAGSTNLLLAGEITAITVTATYGEGYEDGGLTPTGGTLNNGVWTFENGATLTINSMLPMFDVGGVHYGSFADALAAAVEAGTAQNPATIKLLADTSETFTFTGGYIVLDLNGKTMNAGATAKFVVANSGANLTIVDSATGGTVKSGTTGSVRVYGDTAFTTIEAGKYEGTIVVTGQEEVQPEQVLVITGGKFYDEDYEDEGVFYLTAYVVTTTHTITGPDENFYFTVSSNVEPPAPTLIPVPTAATTLVYNGSEQTGVAAGEGYTLGGTYAATNAGEYEATATPDAGHAWSDGTTHTTNISWSIAKATVTATVSLTVTEATYDSTKTTVTDYTTPSLNFGLGAPALVENTDYTVGWSATEVSGAGTFTYTVSPVAESNYTFTEASVTLTITAGSSYPSYIDPTDTEETAKYTAWATYAEVSDVATGEVNEEAYLLNCKPSEVAAAKAAFKFTSISYNSTQSKWVTPTTTSYNNRDYNGEVVVKQYSDVGCTTESSTGTFFKAVLQ